MNYSEALAWLYSTQQFGIKLGLENTHRLLAAAGHPEVAGRFFHVAGTNGKGSTCAMLDAILRAGNYRTGLYTSPHLVNFRERIRVNGEKIPETDVARILTALRNATREWAHTPTYFELTTALALRYFADAGCDYVVLETGMGGRLDSTNAVVPLVSVITPVAMDHAQWLGDTVEKIAAEKAGIIKHGVPVVAASQIPEVEKVLIARAAEQECPFEIVTERSAYPVRLEGEYQRSNAAYAIAAVRAAGIFLEEDDIRSGLSEVEWPGRFQRLKNFVLDGGHNPHAARQLVATWREAFGNERAVVIFGALSDKDYSQVLAILAEVAAEFCFVPVRSARSSSPKDLASASPMPGRIFDSLTAAIDAAGRRGTLITGSLFLVGEALEVLGSEP